MALAHRTTTTTTAPQRAAAASCALRYSLPPSSSSLLWPAQLARAAAGAAASQHHQPCSASSSSSSSGSSGRRAARGGAQGALGDPRALVVAAASAAGPPAAAATTLPELKAQLLQTVTKLNQEADDDPALRSHLLSLIHALEAVNPTPEPARSPKINARWALIFTCPDAPGEKVKRDALNVALKAAYDWFYDNIPIIAGSAVGRKAESRGSVKARGNYQSFDTQRGWVGNQARFEAFGRRGRIDVNGPAKIVDGVGGARLQATFTEAELTWAWLRVPFPIGAFAPTGYIDTLYLDDDLRISKGDKGSIFIARRADEEEDGEQAA